MTGPMSPETIRRLMATAAPWHIVSEAATNDRRALDLWRRMVDFGAARLLRPVK